MIYAFIYALICPETSQIRYVGQTRGKTSACINERLRAHIRESFYNKSNYTHKERWIRRVHTKERPITVELLQSTSLESRDIVECLWISKYPNLTNSTIGGTSKYCLSEQAKQKLSLERLGDKNPMFGKRFKRDPTVGAKISKSLKNSDKFQTSRKSLEYRDKISKVNRKNTWFILSEERTVIVSAPTAKEVVKWFEENHGVKFTESNIKNARRFNRPVGKSLEKKYYISYKSNGDI